MASVDSVPASDNVGRFYIGFSGEVVEFKNLSKFTRVPIVRDWLCTALRLKLFSVPVQWLCLVDDKTAKALGTSDVLNFEEKEYRIVVRRPLIEVLFACVVIFTKDPQCLMQHPFCQRRHD